MSDTVDTAILRQWAISAPVIRRRLHEAIASTRRSQLRLATREGADERSNSPARPSPRQRATHLAAVRSLTPAASAAALSDHAPPTFFLA